jgi:hypothetical protein
MSSPGEVKTTWNVVVTLAEDTFADACRLLGRWGKVESTHFYNVLAMRVADPRVFLHDFTAAVAEAPGLRNIVSHVVPADRTFDFQTHEAFEHKARDILLTWLPRLAGGSFYVRLHRRGGKEMLSTQPEEHNLDGMLLEALATAGTPGRIDFKDPDRVIQIETIDSRAGISLWSREELRQCPFLGVD